nr:proto-oncogene Mas-like [Pogona vitticeps]XP_020664907.1 proto-oncogene Mas-like [Pogona vitticeps]XP_020664914.1 proto-oncogene Mas-like [Pogona vitticeps]XP_020664923.1 proto-oncogene Mas-like [Pogona vitticeps]
MGEANATYFSIADTTKPSFFLKEIVIISSVVIGIVGLIGNGIVTCLFCYRCKNSRFFVYFQNIAFSNTIVLFYVFVFFQRTCFHRGIKLRFLYIIEMLQTLGYNTRFYLLRTVCVERCLMVFWPAWNKRYRPQHTTFLVCGVLWSLSCLTSVVDNLACSSDFIKPNKPFLINCKNASIMRIVIDLAIFLPLVVSCTSAILIRHLTQQVPLARLDITIVATVVLCILSDTPIRIAHNIIYWLQGIDEGFLTTVTQLFHSVHSMASALILVIVGCWKKTSEESFFMFLERALEAEENMALRTEADEEPT